MVGKKSEEEYYFVMCENHRKWKFVSINSSIRTQPCSFACVSFITPVAAFTEMAVLSSWDGHHSVCPANPTVFHLALHRESSLTSVSEPPISPADRSHVTHKRPWRLESPTHRHTANEGRSVMRTSLGARSQAPPAHRQAGILKSSLC